MRLTRHGEYALRAVAFLAVQPQGELSSISEIATRENIPRNFLAKILKDLQRAGVLKSYPGAAGGYRLAKPAEEITYRMVVEAGQGSLTEPADAGSGRNGHGRPLISSIFAHWDEANAEFIRILERTRISDLPKWTPSGQPTAPERAA